MPRLYEPKKRTIAKKFGDAFRGVKAGMRGQGSFYFHIFATVMVVAAGLMLKCNRVEWLFLSLCVTNVFVAEMFNSALEAFATALEKNENPGIGKALNISSAAVLLSAIGSAIVGLVVVLNRLGEMMTWWD